MYLNFLKLYFSWLALQNFLLPWMLSADLLPLKAFALLLGSKEVILIGALVLLMPRLLQPGWHWIAPDVWAVAFTLLLISYLLFAPALLGSTAPLTLRLISLRPIVFMVLFYFWGRLSKHSTNELSHLLKFAIALQACIAVFGILEWAFLPSTFWSNTVELGRFMLDVKGLAEGWNVESGLPSNIFKFGVRRLIATFGDPLSMALASVFPLVLGVAYWLPRKYDNSSIPLWIKASAIFIGLALLLTLGRESIVVALCSLLLVSHLRKKASTTFLLAGSGAMLVLLLPFVAGTIWQSLTFQEDTAATHLSFFTQNFAETSKFLLGRGLGEAGGWAFSLAGIESSVGESSYYELMAQTGMLSVLLMVGFLSSIAARAFRLSELVPERLSAAAMIAIAATIVCRMAGAFFSPSLFAFIPMAILYYIAGAAFSAWRPLHGGEHTRVLVLRPQVAS
jgi:hypothetical protein